VGFRVKGRKIEGGGLKLQGVVCVYRGTSLIRNTPLLRPDSRTIPRVLGWS